MATEHKADDTSGRVAGKSMVDNFFRTALSSGILKVADKLLDSRGITMFLDAMPEWLKDLSPGLEYAATAIIGILPAKMFKTPTAAHFVEEVMVELARHTDKKIKALQKGEKVTFTKDEAIIVSHEVIDKVLAYEYQVDDLGLAHRLDCDRCAQALKGKQGKDGAAPTFRKIKLGVILEQPILIGPCCFKNVQDDLKKSAEEKAAGHKSAAPKPKPRNAAEVMEQADPDDVKTLLEWVDAQMDPYRTEVQLFLQKHLDSVAEVRQLANCIRRHPEQVDFVLKLIQEGNAQHRWYKAMEYITGAWKALGEHNAKLDARFQPYIAEMKARSTTGRTTWQVLTDQPSTSPQSAPKKTKTQIAKDLASLAWVNFCALFKVI